MKLRTKLYVGFGSIVVIFLMLGLNVLHTLSEQQEYLNQIVKMNYERVKISNEIRYNTKTAALEIREILLVKEVNSSKIYELRGRQERTADLISDLYHSNNKNDETKAIIDSLEVHHLLYRAVTDQLIDFIEMKDFTSGTNLLLEEVQNLSANFIHQINQLSNQQEEFMYQSLARSETSYHRSIIVFSVLLIGSLLITLLISVFVVKSISRSINRIRDVITNVPSHFHHELPKIAVLTKDELGEIAMAYNHMAESLEKLARQEKYLTDSLKHDNWVKTSVTEIVSASQEMKSLEEYSSIIVQLIARNVQAKFGLIYLKKKNV
ncbi:MAG: MCP four helix bundle domain-containing protein [Bacillaceae bacterium]|nr:MCP four helix bundle domain-containing protein [Bacillaceae bacterium]